MPLLPRVRPSAARVRSFAFGFAIFACLSVLANCCVIAFIVMCNVPIHAFNLWGHGPISLLSLFGIEYMCRAALDKVFLQLDLEFLDAVLEDISLGFPPVKEISSGLAPHVVVREKFAPEEDIEEDVKELVKGAHESSRAFIVVQKSITLGRRVLDMYTVGCKPEFVVRSVEPSFLPSICSYIQSQCEFSSETSCNTSCACALEMGMNYGIQISRKKIADNPVEHMPLAAKFHGPAAQFDAIELELDFISSGDAVVSEETVDQDALRKAARVERFEIKYTCGVILELAACLSMWLCAAWVIGTEICTSSRDLVGYFSSSTTSLSGSLSEHLLRTIIGAWIIDAWLCLHSSGQSFLTKWATASRLTPRESIVMDGKGLWQGYGLHRLQRIVDDFLACAPAHIICAPVCSYLLRVLLVHPLAQCAPACLLLCFWMQGFAENLRNAKVSMKECAKNIHDRIKDEHYLVGRELRDFVTH